MAVDDKGADAGAADAGADKGAADKAAGTIIDAAADKGGAADAGADKGADAGADKGAAAPDWRTRLAGTDTAELKRLGRFSDEATFYKSYRAMEQRFSSGEFKRALAEGATPEETATWRKENGLPDKVEGYVEKLELPKGLVIGEADKPIVADFAAAAMAGNMEPKQFNGMVNKYYEMLDKQRTAQEDADAAFKAESDEALSIDWPGVEKRKNLVAVQNMLSTWGEGLASRVLAGRTPDGRKLGDDPHFIKQLAALAVELNPTATLVPAGTTDPNKSVAEELEAIRQMRRDDPNKYEADKKLQARELELIGAQLKTQKRVA